MSAGIKPWKSIELYWNLNEATTDKRNCEYRIKPEPSVIFLYDCGGGDPTDVWLGGWPTENTIKREGLVKFREVID